MPIVTVSDAGQDAWLSALLLTPVAFLNVSLVKQLGRSYPGQTLLGITRQLLGKPTSWVVGALYAWLFTHIAALSLRDFGELFLHTVMPATPIVIFQITLLFLTTISILQGIEILARVVELVFPIIVLVMALIFLGNIPNYRLMYLTPIMASGIRPVVSGALTHWPWFAEVVLWTFLVPYFANHRRCLRSLHWALLAGGLALLLVTTSVLMVFSPLSAMRKRYPLFQLAAFISLGGQFRGAESGFLLLWIIVNYCKISLFVLAAALALTEVLQLPDHRPLILPLTTIVMPLSFILFRNYSEFLTFMRPEFLLPYTLPLWLIMPLFLLVASLVTSSARKRERL